MTEKQTENEARCRLVCRFDVKGNCIDYSCNCKKSVSSLDDTWTKCKNEFCTRSEGHIGNCNDYRTIKSASESEKPTGTEKEDGELKTGETMTTEKKQTEKKCRHDMGWCSIDNQCVFIGDEKFYKGKFYLQIGFKSNKVLFECNKRTIGCRAVRNIYLVGKVKKWGKIRL